MLLYWALVAIFAVVVYSVLTTTIDTIIKYSKEWINAHFKE